MSLAHTISMAFGYYMENTSNCRSGVGSVQTFSAVSTAKNEFAMSESVQRGLDI